MVVVLGLLLLGPQTLPVQPLDCRALLEKPAPGIELLCQGEEAVRLATAAPGDSPERRAQWEGAARAYGRAVDLLRATEHKVHALEMLVRLNDATHLRSPEGMEQALRALVQVDIGRPDPAIRLAKFLEERTQADAAEDTLLFARQQYPEALDLTRELAKFFARRVLALTPKDAEGKPILPPPPEPAWKPDCQQMAFGAPGAGVGDICRAEVEMRRGLGRASTPEEVKAVLALSRKERLAHMETAADLYRRAVTSLRETDQKIYVYDALARLYAGTNLNEPQQAEAAVQQLIAISPGKVEPILQLATVQEDMKLSQVAEQTLIGTRQLYPEEIEVLKALSRFYARQATAASLAQNRAESEREPAPPPNQPDAEGNYRVGSQIPPPKRIEHKNPGYPDEARAVGLEGVVIIEIWVDETGRVTSARLVRGIPMLEEVAVATAMQWRFEPAVVNGKPIPVRMIVTHNFMLRR